jgi:hypothetical protein
MQARARHDAGSHAKRGQHTFGSAEVVGQNRASLRAREALARASPSDGKALELDGITALCVN